MNLRVIYLKRDFRIEFVITIEGNAAGAALQAALVEALENGEDVDFSWHAGNNYFVSTKTIEPLYISSSAPGSMLNFVMSLITLWKNNVRVISNTDETLLFVTPV